MRPSPGLGRAEQRWMTDVANVWRSSSVPDGSGGQTVSWVQAGTTPVQLTTASASERETAAQEGVEVTHIVKMPLGSGVVRGDRLAVGAVTVEIVTVETGTHVTVDRARGREEPWDEPTT